VKVLVVNGTDRYLVAESVAESLREYDAALRHRRQSAAVELPIHILDGKRDEITTVSLPARLRFEPHASALADPVDSVRLADVLDYARWQLLDSGVAS
jgi:hypothetical protein